MKQHSYILLFLFGVCISLAQNSKRQLINGEINVINNDVGGINVYNTSTNKGTITNDLGEFTIEVGLNDKLEISALQFKKRTIIINEEIFKNKLLKIALTENINTLDEVTVLPYELSGYITEDVSTSKVVEPFTFSFSSFNDYEFSDDYKSKVDNTVIVGRYRNGVNFTNVFYQLIKPLFKKKKGKNYNETNIDGYKKISNKYSSLFLLKNFNIPEGEAGLFIEYVENNGLTQELLKEGNEIKLIEFIQEKSKQYLLETNERD